MNRSILVWTTAIFLMTASAAVVAQRGGSGAPKVNHGQAATSPKPAVAHGGPAPATAKGSGGTKTKITSKSTQGQAGARAAAKPVKTTMTKTTTSKTSKAASPKTKSTTTTKTTTKTASSKTKSTTTTPTSGGTTLSPVQQKLQRNTNLAAKLQSRLPAGTDLTAAAAGFRNLGQFVAAVNVSNNLGIKFSDLKTRMVDQKMSLGQAMQDVRGGTGTQTTARRAEQDADEMIRATSPVTKTTTAAKATGKPATKVGKTGATRS